MIFRQLTQKREACVYLLFYERKIFKTTGFPKKTVNL